jgi:hypothetical protein
MFLQTWEREFQTTLKVLKAYPANKLDFKPHERSMSAKELAWSFPTEDSMAVHGVANGRINFENSPKPPATVFRKVVSCSISQTCGRSKSMPDNARHGPRRD